MPPRQWKFDSHFTADRATFFVAHLNLGIVFAQIGRFFCTSTTWTLLLYNGEIFPTILRNTSIGIGTLSGKLLSVAAPFLLFAGKWSFML